MLLHFELSNWKSFYESASFSLVATREKRHTERLPIVEKYRMKVLPVSVLYGGNASGKTNFFSALSFIRDFVVEGSKTPDSLINVEPFKLGTNSNDEPSSFCIGILVDDMIYELSFSVTRKKVLEEKLVKITSYQETVLYERSTSHLDDSIRKNPAVEYLLGATGDNQLFLTSAVSQKIDVFRPVYDWFYKSLVLIAPDSRFRNFEHLLDEDNPLYSDMNKLLPLLDTGIEKLGSGDEKLLEEDQLIPDEIRGEIKSGKAIRLVAGVNSYIISRKDDDLYVKQLVTYRNKEGGELINFEMRDESDGTRRVIDLLPAFLGACRKDSKKVYLIDEIDRSLHTTLIYKLVQSFLGNCSSDCRSQILFTTHNVNLLDQNLLRRDEIWVTEREQSGNTIIYSLSDFKGIRYDKDIRKTYLQGLLGGVPKIIIDSNVIDRLEGN